MSKQAIIEDLLEAVRLRMPTWGFVPFTMMYIDPKNIKVLDSSGYLIAGDMVLLLRRTDYMVKDALDYIHNTEEMQHLSDSRKRDVIEHFFCRFAEDDELSIWIQQRIAMALGIMQVEAKKLNLVNHGIDLASIKEFNQGNGLSPQFLFELSYSL